MLHKTVQRRREISLKSNELTKGPFSRRRKADLVFLRLFWKRPERNANLSPEELEAVLNEKVAEGMINISMNTAPYFENGVADGNLMIVNESINNYPQKVQIVRNDTGEQIYESGAIAVGSKIERAKLDAELVAGTYECTAYFHNLDPKTGEIIGTAGAIINITIKN